MKQCSKCKSILPLSGFHKRNGSKSGYTSHCKTCRNKHHSEYKQKNPHIRNAGEAKRRAMKLNATPEWADTNYIQELYSNAKEAQNLFGVEFHVDHIVPLSNSRACGLHNQFNLQILSAKDNLQKSNKFKIS